MRATRACRTSDAAAINRAEPPLECFVAPLLAMTLLSLPGENVFHDVDRTPQQRHRGFERAERGMCRQRDIGHAGQRMVGLERL